MLTPTNSTGPSHIEAFYASIARFTRTGKRLTHRESIDTWRIADCAGAEALECPRFAGLVSRIALAAAE